MDTLWPEVYAALQLTTYSVFYIFPARPMALPCITYRESNNYVHATTEVGEAITGVEYTIDAWASTPEVVNTMGASIDTQLAAIGLERTFSHDLFEADTSTYHKNMRYRGLIHIAEQKVYQ